MLTVGRPRLIRTNETGQTKAEKTKVTQSTPIKQTTDATKVTAQNPVSIVDLPIVIGDVVPSTPIGSEIATSIEHKANTTDINPIIITAEDLNNSSILSMPPVQMAASNSLTSTPKPFVKLAPPTGGRIQSTGVKNFFIRTGIEKQPSAQPMQTTQSFQPAQQLQAIPTVQSVQPFHTVQSVQSLQSPTIISTPMTQPTVTSSPIPQNKKIVIKSQQIIKPATTISQELTPFNASIASSSITVVNANDSAMDTSADLSAILDLPILFADNDGSIIESDSSQIFNTSTTSNPQIITSSQQIITCHPQLNTTHTQSITTNPQIFAANPTIVPTPTMLPVTTTPRMSTTTHAPPNIIFTPTDGSKMTATHRPIMIGAAKTGQKTKPTNTMVKPSSSNKVILINRNTMKPQIVTHSTGTPPTGVMKTMPTIKFLQTTVSQTGQTQQLPTNVTKLTPATKLGFPSFKLVKNVVTSTASTSAPTIVRKPNQVR